MIENKLDALRVIEKRIVQMHLLYPDTEAYVWKETESQIVYKVVVKK